MKFLQDVHALGIRVFVGIYCCEGLPSEIAVVKTPSYH
jgi:hypothetical protein